MAVRELVEQELVAAASPPEPVAAAKELVEQETAAPAPPPEAVAAAQVLVAARARVSASELGQPAAVLAKAPGSERLAQ